MMIFKYSELKQYVEDDFNRFYEMGFSGIQIFPAVLNEYEHGEGFCLSENICIHISLALNYIKNNLKCDEIVNKLEKLLSDDTENKLETELGNEYAEFAVDLSIIRNGGGRGIQST